jgi:hypothetical protein
MNAPLLSLSSLGLWLTWLAALPLALTLQQRLQSSRPRVVVWARPQRPRRPAERH